MDSTKPHDDDSAVPVVAALQSVEKSYQMDDVTVPVLKGIDVDIRPAMFTVLLGPSGSGKTTLLNLLGCLDRPDKGKVIVSGTDINALTDDEMSDFRSENIGFVFQSFNLIPVLTAFENVEYPLILAGMAPERRQRRVKRLLEAVGLEQKAQHRPGQLSGGQRQRVAIARALARKPKLVIADEPTANLDSQTGFAIIALMRWMQQNFKISFIFSSHDSGLIKAADDLIVLRDGVIQSVRRKADPVSQPAGTATVATEDSFEAPAWGSAGPDTDFAFLDEATGARTR
jgi:putative ABC transport system ATP-binding protein